MTERQKSWSESPRLPETRRFRSPDFHTSHTGNLYVSCCFSHSAYDAGGGAIHRVLGIETLLLALLGYTPFPGSTVGHVPLYRAPTEDAKEGSFCGIRPAVVALSSVRCTHFSPYLDSGAADATQVAVTGKGKPVLSLPKDAARPDRYVQRFREESFRTDSGVA